MPAQQKCVFTVRWIVKDGEVEAALDIVARFAREARKEPGLELLSFGGPVARIGAVCVVG